MTIEIAILLGLVIGLILGLTGAGGSVFAIPALILLAGVSMQTAAPIALIAVIGGASLGTIDGLRHGIVRYRAASVVALCAIPFTALGLWCAHVIQQGYLQIAFVVVVLLVARRMLLASRAKGYTPELTPDLLAKKPIKISETTGRFIWSIPTFLRFACLGALAGFLTGLLGVSGGFMIVPLLRFWTPLPMRTAVGTSLMIMLLISTVSVIVSISVHITIPMPFTLYFTICTMIGTLIARKFAKKISDRLTQRIFGCTLLVIAALMLVSAVQNIYSHLGA